MEFWQRNMLAMINAPRYMLRKAGRKRYLPSGCMVFFTEHRVWMFSLNGTAVPSQQLGLTPWESPTGQCIPVLSNCWNIPCWNQRLVAHG